LDKINSFFQCSEIVMAAGGAMEQDKHSKLPSKRYWRKSMKCHKCHQPVLFSNLCRYHLHMLIAKHEELEEFYHIRTSKGDVQWPEPIPLMQAIAQWYRT